MSVLTTWITNRSIRVGFILHRRAEQETLLFSLSIHVQLSEQFQTAVYYRNVCGKGHGETSAGSAVPDNLHGTSWCTVGSPGFYRKGNPYVFRMHIDINFYIVLLVQAVSLVSKQQPTGGPSKQPGSVVYSTSESKFHATSRSATITALDDAGFKNITGIKFDPFQGDDANGILNRDFLNSLADQACLKNSEEAEAYPVIFMCTHEEQDMIRNWNWS